jgi:hypothetical protein
VTGSTHIPMVAHPDTAQSHPVQRLTHLPSNSVALPPQLPAALLEPSDQVPPRLRLVHVEPEVPGEAPGQLPHLLRVGDPVAGDARRFASSRTYLSASGVVPHCGRTDEIPPWRWGWAARRGNYMPSKVFQKDPW